VVVNDRSTDRTAEIVASFQQRDPRLKRIDIDTVPADLLPKQNALARGIEASRGEILCLTDADCLPGPRWIASLASAFAPDVGMVAGYSQFSSCFLPAGRSLLYRMFDAFVRYEEYRKAVRSAGVALSGKAWACTGRNFAFRRAAYDAVGGYRGIPHSVSGDDTLMLQRMGMKTSWKYFYILAEENFVPTAPPATVAELLNQRARHSRGAVHFPGRMRLTIFLLLCANLLLVAALGVGLLIPAYRLLGLGAFGVKCVVDTVLYLSAAGRFRAWEFAPSFLLLEQLCSVYYFALLFVALINPRFEWKP
jgi:cellulose synthase/poly-beta-1,6-N-acetylglucosamine synthase-like glycosyltransferase